MRKVAALVLAVGAALCLIGLAMLPRVLGLIEQHLSRDAQLSRGGVTNVVVQLSFWFLVLASGAWTLHRSPVTGSTPHRWPRATNIAPGALLTTASLLLGWALSTRPDLFDEDGLVENVQVALLAAATLLFAAVAGKAAHRGDRPVTVLVVCMALVCLTVTGEELSWGQRIFGWSTPEAWVTHNYQGETNLHNTFDIFLLTRYLPLLGFALVWLGTLSVVSGRGVELAALAPGPEMLIPAGTVLIANYGFDFGRIDLELMELQISLCIALYAWGQRRRERLAEASSS